MRAIPRPRPRSVIIWRPGTSTATADVAAGLEAGLTALGVVPLPYHLATHISTASEYLRLVWKRTAGVRPRPPKPSDGDALYFGSAFLLERAARFRREFGARWVICVSGMYQAPDYLWFLRDCGFRVALLTTETPYELVRERRLAGLADVVFTNERAAVDVFREVNSESYYLPHAWNPRVTHAARPAARQHDVVFVGTGWIERVAWLSAMDWTGIDLGLYGSWSLLGSRSALRRYLQPGEVPNQAAHGLYQAAKIGINLHRRSMAYGRQPGFVGAGAVYRGPGVDRPIRWDQEPESLNPRAYELAASGCCVLTDERLEGVEKLPADAICRTPAEMERRIRALLERPSDRTTLATAARAAVAGDTWTARSATILDRLAALDGETAVRERQRYTRTGR